MSLHKLVRLAPTFFYVIGGASLFFGILLPLVELNRYGFSTDLPAQEGLVRSIVFKHIVKQVVDASYILANGVIIHVLIAIWDQIGLRKAEAAE